MKRIILLFLLVKFHSAYSQSRSIDSLKQVVEKVSSDTVRIRLACTIALKCTPGDSLTAELFFKKAEDLCHTKKVKKLSYVKLNKGIYYFHSNKLIKSLMELNSAIELAEAEDELIIKADAHDFLATKLFANTGMIDDAEFHLRKAVECNFKLNDSNRIGTSFYVLGWMEYNNKKFDSSLMHLRLANKFISKYTTPVHFQMEVKGWMGNVYSGLNKIDSAILIRKQVLAQGLQMGEGYEDPIADCYRYIGMFYLSKKEYDSAYAYLKRAEVTFEKTNFLRSVIIKHALLLILVKQDRMEDARKLVALMTDSVRFNYKKNDYCKKMVSKSLVKYYQKISDYKKVAIYLEEYSNANDSIYATMQRQDLLEQNNKYKFQKEQARMLLDQQRKDFEAMNELKKQQYVTYVSWAGITVVVVLLFMAFRVIREKKTAYKLVSEQKLEVEMQKQIVENKNKEIEDSIIYAKRLQEAILPNTIDIRSAFCDSFLLYKPKDIVAGDFYFFAKHQSRIVIAAADCTGHGVPGAMVSVVCSNALSRSVSEFGITEPGKLLDKTKELVLDTFSKSSIDVKDGMDISLLIINYSDDQFTQPTDVSWSGANNGLLYISQGEVREIKPNKQPIGYTDDSNSFNTHKIEFKRGDKFYLYTDGYTDQFGGPKGKKFKHKAFVQLIDGMKGDSMIDQLKKLDTAFTNWKGDLEQLDDVCIIGIEI